MGPNEYLIGNLLKSVDGSNSFQIKQKDQYWPYVFLYKYRCNVYVCMDKYIVLNCETIKIKRK